MEISEQLWVRLVQRFQVGVKTFGNTARVLQVGGKAGICRQNIMELSVGKYFLGMLKVL